MVHWSSLLLPVTFSLPLVVVSIEPSKALGPGCVYLDLSHTLLLSFLQCGSWICPLRCVWNRGLRGRAWLIRPQAASVTTDAPSHTLLQCTALRYSPHTPCCVPWLCLVFKGPGNAPALKPKKPQRASQHPPSTGRWLYMDPVRVHSYFVFMSM